MCRIEKIKINFLLLIKTTLFVVKPVQNGYMYPGKEQIDLIYFQNSAEKIDRIIEKFNLFSIGEWPATKSGQVKVFFKFFFSNNSCGPSFSCRFDGF